MRLLFHSCMLFAAALISGCAMSHGGGMVLDPVGPPSVVAPVPADHGSLVVFSAYVSGEVPNLPDGVRQHSDYDIQSADGKPLQTVHNNTGSFGRYPLPVDLPAGRYRIVVPSNSYGLVTVPVVIAVNQTTTIHLEGSADWPDAKLMTPENSVRLADGEVVGWRAVSPDSFRP